MPRLLHIVGHQGTGKSVLGRLIVDGINANDGLIADFVDAEEALFLTNDQIRQTYQNVNDVVVVSDELGDRHADVAPGDRVICILRTTPARREHIPIGEATESDFGAFEAAAVAHQVGRP